jgi:polyphosphate kinase
MSADKTQSKKHKTAYFNRELSWLTFNRRVLDQAMDKRYPVLERMMFMTFVSSNLDEFFEIRVSGLMQQVEANFAEPDLAGLGPKEQLRRIHDITLSLVKDQYRCWFEDLVPSLKEAGIHFKQKTELTSKEKKWLEHYFLDQVYPVLTPLANDPSHPFPQFGNKTLNILLWLDDPQTPETETMLAFIPVPRILPRVVHVPDSGKSKGCYVFLSDVLKLFAGHLFPGYNIKALHAFRITRNSDLYIDEEEVENLLQTIEKKLYKMRRGEAVRLEVESGVNEELLERLLTSINLSRQHVFHIDGPINLMRLRTTYDLIDRPDLKFKPIVPFLPSELVRPANIYDSVREKDWLLHHPYDSFEPVVEFVQQAARDPKVLAIKMTLYRTSSDSPIVKALIDAARCDKQVTALIELKARFDEAANISWAKRLEEAGVHVVYGLVGLKTHCKCCLVVRKDADGLRRYVHLGTGNYHSKTAKLYTDISVFSARDSIATEVAELFNTLTGFAKAPVFKHLLVAPYNLHQRLCGLIRNETANARDGKPARIIIKCNSLIDRETIDALYEASCAGVSIDLIIRGICGLVPGVKGMSEHIRVISILGRFLEHSRLFYFLNHGDDPVILCGSADWMPRNFFKRVEVIFPIEDPHLRQKLLEEILKMQLSDTDRARILQSNGGYAHIPVQKGAEPFSAQDHFLAEAERQNRLAQVVQAELQRSESFPV